MRAASLPAPLLLAASAQAVGLSFGHKDWELACDNGGTCRAAGYQAEDGGRMAVSVLLTRAAGPGSVVSGRVALGSYLDDAPKAPPQVAMVLNGLALGPVVLTDAEGDLSQQQVDALVAALPGQASIAFTVGKLQWRLSASGAAAVLLKMDEAQGRLGTRGALVRKGEAAEDKVPPARPLSVVHAAPVVPAQPGDAELAQRLRAQLKAPADLCDRLGDRGEPTSVWRLDATRVLVSALCWRAAANEGYGFWIANDKPPHTPRLVTTKGSSYDEQGTITAGHKGRGLGDCYSTNEWVWDGRDFVLTEAATTGLCRRVSVGGPWSLPTWITEVRRPPNNPFERKSK